MSDDGEVSCRLVSSKSRVTPIKRPTMQRLELTAAVVSVKVALSLRKELQFFHPGWVFLDERGFTCMSIIECNSSRNTVTWISGCMCPSKRTLLMTPRDFFLQFFEFQNSKTTLKNRRWINGSDQNRIGKLNLVHYQSTTMTKKLRSWKYRSMLPIQMSSAR